jgi:hypothetical protein
MRRGCHAAHEVCAGLLHLSSPGGNVGFATPQSEFEVLFGSFSLKGRTPLGFLLRKIKCRYSLSRKRIK